jgi:hypothetical protein
MQYNELALDDWEAKYRPINNPINHTSGWNGKMFDTYGKELAYVLNQKPENIWTWWDTDSGSEIVAGYHLVNRIGYFITENSWSEPLESYDVEIREEDDDEDE